MPGPQAGPVSACTASSLATRAQQRECGPPRPHSTPRTFMLTVGLLLVMMHAARVSASETTLLPYIPTNILVPGSTSGVAYGRETGNANSTAYIFTPNADGSVDLLAVDISSSLAASSVSGSAETLTPGLPFLSSSTNTTTFTPTLTSDGSILAYAGDCSSATGSSVWVYNATTSHQASWVEHSIINNGAAAGPYFLGGGFSFSQTISPSLSQPLVYVYGGQCPNETLGDQWTSAATYSNSMVRLTASPSPSSAPAYTASQLSLKSQPIAEAGFSLTSLPPATSNISGIVTQSINSVVLGGHTQTAFVNMSTAAVWSLPEETWSFVAISGPSSSSSGETAELAKNDGAVTEVQPRSGHTAVLNEAGSALVVLGGWVGDTSQAAQPQLAVLQMSGSEFGEWTWSVPNEQPLADGQGIYGHGAALLPGNVMMVSGGYAISSGSSGSGLGKRDSIGVAGGQLQMFLNMTSLTWSDSYTNPISASAPSAGGTAPPTSPYKLGLGLGLGLGVPVLLLVLAVCFFCWRRRQRLRHQARDEHIRNLTTGTAFITSDEMLERENVYPWGPRTAARWYTGGHDPYLRDQGNAFGYENLRAPEGPRSASDDPIAVESLGAYRRDIRRRPVPRVARGLYQPTGVTGDDVMSPGGIHPILEDEEDEIAAADAIAPDRDEENDDDPFTTPVPSTPTKAGPSLASPIVLVAPGNRTAGSGPASPTESTPRPRPQHPEVQDWISDIDASDALITARIQPHSTTFRNSGKISPTRRPSVRLSEDETAGGARTDSNLSESNRSTFSFIVNRSDSLRVAGAGAGSGALAVSKSRGEQERTGTSHSDKSGSSNSNTTQESFTTAKSITALQSEGPGLLLGRPRPISDIEDLGHMSDDDPLAPGSPSKSKPPRRSWFGSLKRVFSAGAGSGSSNGSSSRTGSPTHGRSSDYDVLGLGNLGLGGVGLLQKRRQGRSAWDEAGASASGGGQRTGESWEEDDWDIEKAVEQRLVQVMFSVPKDRLRVVNADNADLVSLEESVILVDPAKDDPMTPETAAAGRDEEKVTTQDDGHEEAAEDVSSVASQTEETSRARREKIQQGKQPERPPLSLKVPQPPGSETSEDSRRRSISPVLRTAETVRIERPRTRVLDMVESFESRSKSSSPERRSTPDKRY
ncbi:hypothetical protein KVR01_002812 [Diaporthe batatas]|uniref:uncharacterized protein n=1 Tax=Diaporthe batatas TaxID=748121 RepID=UPI001D039838|nr:uncharacterized protein KVR01_002812 [Diaporthe batatas]KAG8167123.1 hypothetical protein KVR01_002812 [Diaporthe batatas]